MSLMPELVKNTLESGVVGRAFQSGFCQMTLINPRDFTEDRHQTVDDRPFGGGDGMLMMPAPLQKALESRSQKASGPVIYLSPQGERLTDQRARQLCKETDLTLICGRYGGVDERFLRKNNVQELSIGDYVLSGGELAAAVLIDVITRLKPGVLGHMDSASVDSFAQTPWLEAPHFTRPREWQGLDVPPILLTGDHQKIELWKRHMSRLTTVMKRPDLVAGPQHTEDLKESLEYFSQLSEENLTFLSLSREEIIKLLSKRAHGTD